MRSRTPVRKVTTSAYRIPTDFPEGDGTFTWEETILVLVEVEAGGKTGLGFTYADAAAAVVVESLLREVLEGEEAMDVYRLRNKMVRKVRNLGRPGIASMAISAVDVALWDLKAKILGLPLITLLGSARDAVPVYGSGGFTTYPIDRLQEQLAGWVGSGITRVKMKVGARPAEDAGRVKAAREAIGTEADLFVDANGAYSVKEALVFADAFAAQCVVWFEEPVSSDNPAGLAFLRERAPLGMEIAAGEYGYDLTYFRNMLEKGAVDVLMADATRCGGITGFREAGVLCESFHLPLSAHTSPSVHLHPCCACTVVRHIEYFHDHVRIEGMLFDGAAKADRGMLRPDLSRPGLGLELKRSDAKHYEI